MMKKFAIPACVASVAAASLLAVAVSGTAAPKVAPPSETFGHLSSEGRAATAGGLVATALAGPYASPPNAKVQPATARILSSSSSKVVGWVASTGPAPCIYTIKPGKLGNAVSTSCGTTPWETAQVRFGEAIGIVPDDVKSVTYSLTDGTTTEVPVSGNVWSTDLDEAERVTFTTAGEEHSVDLMPLSTLPKGYEIAADGTVGPVNGPAGFNDH